MRRLKFFTLSILLASVLSSCILFIYTEGEVYIAYGWNNGIYHLYDNNPAVPQDPNIIVEDNYYISDPGTFWGGYKYSALNSYILYSYTLIPDKAGYEEDFKPDNAYFYIFLHEDGPVFYNPIYQAPASIRKISKSITLVDKSIYKNVKEEDLGEPTGIIESKKNGYRMTVKYWKVE